MATKPRYPERELTKDEIEKIVQEARNLIAAHESRSPSSGYATLGELTALFELMWAIREVRGV